MKATLIIKDLALDKALDGKEMSAVRGGLGNQANATDQSNLLGLLAPVNVANGASVSGPAIFQVDSNPTQTASNDNTSSNAKSLSLSGLISEFA